MWIIWVIVAIAYIIVVMIIIKRLDDYWLGRVVWITIALVLLGLGIIMQRYNPTFWQAFVNFVGATGR
ncbi:MAG: hypothetical protein AAB116_22540 [Candidatus Poribacteria bacterium]